MLSWGGTRVGDRNCRNWRRPCQYHRIGATWRDEGSICACSLQQHRAQHACVVLDLRTSTCEANNSVIACAAPSDLRIKDGVCFLSVRMDVDDVQPPPRRVHPPALPTASMPPHRSAHSWSRTWPHYLCRCHTIAPRTTRKIAWHVARITLSTWTRWNGRRIRIQCLRFFLKFG